jgi:hypothetical protein
VSLVQHAATEGKLPTWFDWRSVSAKTAKERGGRIAALNLYIRGRDATPSGSAFKNLMTNNRFINVPLILRQRCCARGVKEIANHGDSRGDQRGNNNLPPTHRRVA